MEKTICEPVFYCKLISKNKILFTVLHTLRNGKYQLNKSNNFFFFKLNKCQHLLEITVIFENFL